MPNRDLVVIGASAGGVDALIRLVTELPRDLSAAVLVVMHLAPEAKSNLPRILDRSGALPAIAATDGLPIRPGMIICAPPDHHMSIEAGQVRLSRGPHENLHRPSVDVLFRSAALREDGHTCGVVLSGALDDGRFGMRAIHRMGGLTIVQDPADALVPGMPLAVLEAIEPDHVLSATEIGRQLPRLLEVPIARSRRGTREADRKAMRVEVAMSTMDQGARDEEPPGAPSKFGCPDCGGVLWELDDEGELRFRCRTGHAYSSRTLLAAEDTQLEDALWAALRALEEQEALGRRLLERGLAGGPMRSRERLQQRVDDAHRRAEVLRGFLLTPVGGKPADGGSAEVRVEPGPRSEEQATA